MTGPRVVSPLFTGKRVEVWFDPTRDPAKNVAREEELFRMAEGRGISQLARLWANDECLVKGRSKSPKHGWFREQLAEEMGIPVVERLSGGGVVYHDGGNLNWSFYLRGSGVIVSPRTLFEGAAAYVLGALRKMGARAEFSAPNRIDVDGKKVSGLAARTSPKGILVHGTLLVSSDLAKLNSLCIPPPGCPPVSNLTEWVPGADHQSVARSLVEFLVESGFEVTTRGAPFAPAKDD